MLAVDAMRQLFLCESEVGDYKYSDGRFKGYLYIHEFMIRLEYGSHTRDVMPRKSIPTEGFSFWGRFWWALLIMSQALTQYYINIYHANYFNAS